jgi:hypothetical protein
MIRKSRTIRKATCGPETSREKVKEKEEEG